MNHFLFLTARIAPTTNIIAKIMDLYFNEENNENKYNFYQKLKDIFFDEKNILDLFNNKYGKILMIKFCNLYSGSSGNSTYIETEKSKILVDAGVSCQKIAKALSELGVELDEINAILITHEHIDHTNGLTTITKKYNTTKAKLNTKSKYSEITRQIF